MTQTTSTFRFSAIEVSILRAAILCLATENTKPENVAAINAMCDKLGATVDLRSPR